MNKVGKFIVVEGGDYCGKTTFVDQLNRVIANNDRVTQHLRLPGSGEVGEKIRDILVNYELDDVIRECLFKANRRYIGQQIEPLLASGVIVTCTRWIQSAEVYQLDSQNLRDVTTQMYPDKDPDIFILLHVNDETFNKAYVNKDETDLLGDENIEDYKGVRERYDTAYERFHGTKFKIEYNTGADKPPTDEEFVQMYPGLINAILGRRSET